MEGMLVSQRIRYVKLSIATIKHSTQTIWTHNTKLISLIPDITQYIVMFKTKYNYFLLQTCQSRHLSNTYVHFLHVHTHTCAVSSHWCHHHLLPHQAMLVLCGTEVLKSLKCGLCAKTLHQITIIKKKYYYFIIV